MKLLEKVIGVVAPHTCLICGKEGAVLCPWCLPEAAEVLPSRCYRCKRYSADSLVCRSCRRAGSKLRYVWVRCQYQGFAKDLVYMLKFNRASAAALPIARLIDEVIPWLDSEIVIIPVPTATARRRARGYDHAELITKELARLRGLSYSPLLIRVGQSRQVGSSRSERLSQLESAFIARKHKDIRGVRIVLVDDIVTSGGTLEAAAKVLKKAGARSVDAVAFAQKQ